MPSKRLDKHVRWSTSGASDVTEAETLEHSLPLTARDEAISCCTPPPRSSTPC
jgi:hypothetical protein